jgi:hypothetical protein
MRARMLVLPVAAGLVAGGVASASACRLDARLRIRFTPPAGAVFGWFEVRVRGRQVVRLTGIPRAASATIRLPHGRSTVRVEGETLGGQFVDSVRVYRTCEPPPAPPPSPPLQHPIQQGGGED